MQNLNEPEIYAVRDECDLIVRNSPYAEEFEKEFGEMIFRRTGSLKPAKNPDSLRLKSEELQLKMQYKKIMACPNIDGDELFGIFDRLIETRIRLAESLGYKSYVELGYAAQNRYDYGSEELRNFRNDICRFITPICSEIKQSGIDLRYQKSILEDSKALVSAVKNMFEDMSEETGEYIKEVVEKELYDLKPRENKRKNLFTCCMIPVEKLPFIIANYSGDGMEMGYFVHELGHGFAFRTAAINQPLYEMHRSSPSVNEIHSKTMEHFMYPYLNMFVGGKEKEYIRAHLMQQLENMPYRCAVDEFEHTVYNMENRSRKEICRLWADLCEKYTPWAKPDKKTVESGMFFPYQTHISESPFYYIEYDIAQVSVYEFYGKMKNDCKRAWEDYMKLCRAGGSKSYFNLLKTANLSNPFSNNTVERIFRPIIDELTGLI
ncbi:MAG: hypothetical protein K2J73_08320 [Oscillospiraceae bacterium]|nr:hypothetical protein [Oscillospiraceae bacterium]